MSLRSLRYRHAREAECTPAGLSHKRATPNLQFVGQSVSLIAPFLGCEPFCALGHQFSEDFCIAFHLASSVFVERIDSLHERLRLLPLATVLGPAARALQRDLLKAIVSHWFTTLKPFKRAYRTRRSRESAPISRPSIFRTK